jgi:hypothetical protein
MAMLGGLMSIDAVMSPLEVSQAAFAPLAKLGKVVKKLPPGVARPKCWEQSLPRGSETLIAYDPLQRWGWGGPQQSS